MSDVMVETQGPVADRDGPEEPVGPAGGWTPVMSSCCRRWPGGWRRWAVAGREGGFLLQMTKLVLEAGLQAEMSGHLGYDRHDRAGRDGGNSSNGTRTKTVITEVGPVEIGVPRDRDASFEPVTVPKRCRRLRGVDEMVVSLVARGMTSGDVQAHLAEVYGR